MACRSALPKIALAAVARVPIKDAVKMQDFCVCLKDAGFGQT